MAGKRAKEIVEKPQRYIFIDTETTGLDPALHDVIEVAALVMEEDINNIPKEIARYHGKWGITDGIVDIEALHVNGRLATDDVFGNDLQYKASLINGFADFLAKYVTSTTFIIGGNVGFDIDFINALFKKYGLDATRILSKRKAVDIQHIARFLYDAALIDVPDFRMATLVWHILGANVWPHNAMQDVLLSKDLYFTMREMV